MRAARLWVTSSTWCKRVLQPLDIGSQGAVLVAKRRALVRQAVALDMAAQRPAAARRPASSPEARRAPRRQASTEVRSVVLPLFQAAQPGGAQAAGHRRLGRLDRLLQRQTLGPRLGSRSAVQNWKSYHQPNEQNVTTDNPGEQRYRTKKRERAPLIPKYLLEAAQIRSRTSTDGCWWSHNAACIATPT